MRVLRLGVAIAVLVVLVFGGWFVFSRTNSTPTDTKPVTVAATIFPLADIIKNVGGDRVGVVLLIPPGVSEHSAALSPQTLAQLQQAQALFAIGQGLEDHLVERVVSSKKMPVITLERGITLREFGGDEGTDPHYWLTVPNASRMAQTVAEELTKLDPEGGPAYAGRLADYQGRLAELETELQAKAASVSQKNFFAAHDGWSYFAPHYGLELVATYEPVEGQEPSAQDLQHLGEVVRQFNLKTFYAEPQKTGATETRFLEREFGLKVLVLDPVGGQEENDSYEALMRRNIEAIANPGVARVQAEGGVEEVSLVAFAEREFDGQDFRVGEVLARTDAYTRYAITYKSGELTISGIMNAPTGSPPAGGFPVLILNHGYIDPAVYTTGRGLKREQDYLARRGYVVIHPDYRNYAFSDDDPDNDVRFRLGYAEDVINLVKAVEASELPYLDSDKIGLLGHSMGGGVAQVIAVTQPNLVDAIVLFAPVSSDARDNFQKWTTRRPELAAKVVERYGDPETNPNFWDGISPTNFVSNVVVPIMIHHGTADESVPLDWSEHTVAKLQSAGKDVTFHVYPGEPHEFIDAWGQVMQRTLEFFDAHVARK